MPKPFGSMVKFQFLTLACPRGVMVKAMGCGIRTDFSQICLIFISVSFDYNYTKIGNVDNVLSDHKSLFALVWFLFLIAHQSS